MSFAQGPSSKLFSPMFNGQPISVLFLVENSSEMSHIWPSVFERGLTPIAHAFQSAANASGPLSVIVLESFPADNGVSGMAPRQYQDCQTAFSNMRFNPHSENRISIGRMTHGIELLESAKTVGQPSSLHLVVVAATPPVDDETGIPSPSDYSPWSFVSQRLIASRIQCHLVVTQQASVSSLAKLYEETLRLTPNVVEEAYCTSQSASGIIVRLSTRANEETYHDQVATSPQYAQQQNSASRRNSFPMNGLHPDQQQLNAAVMAPFPTEPDASPRLVSQLQSVHGLTKKKVYGAKPVREPFFGGEVREKFAPPPLTVTTMTPTMPTTIPNAMTPLTMGDMSSGGGRVLTHSKIDRMGRLGQASPTDMHGRRHMWPRRESRLGTPEAEGMAWANAQAQAGYQQNPAGVGGMSMAVDPASMAGMGGAFAMDGSVGQMGNAQAAMAAQYAAAGGMADPQWLSQPQQQPMAQPSQLQQFAQSQQQQQQQQFAASYPAQPGYYAQTPVQSSTAAGNFFRENTAAPSSDMVPQRPFAPTYNSYPPFPASSNSQGTLPPTPTVPSNAGPMAPPQGMPMQSASGAIPELTLEELTSVRPPKRTVVSTPADKETFDFSAPFVAASSVMFEQEVVNEYPPIPNVVAGQEVPTQKLEADLAKLNSPADAGELFATRVAKQGGSPPRAPPTASTSSTSSTSSSRGAKGKAPQHPHPHQNQHAHQSQQQHAHMSAQAMSMQQQQHRAAQQQMAPPPTLPHHHQHQQQIPAPMHSMTYHGGGYHDTGPGNMGHATMQSTYTPNYASSSLTGWAG